MEKPNQSTNDNKCWKMQKNHIHMISLMLLKMLENKYVLSIISTMKLKRERTIEKIKKCYINLLLLKGPTDITVSEICKKSRINRSTFYKYYSYIDLLIEDIIRDQINEISKVNDVLYDQFYIENTTGPKHVAAYMQNIAGNAVLMRFIKSSDSHLFKTLITKTQCEYEINRYQIKDNARTIRIIYRNSGVLSVVYGWIAKQDETDLMEIATRLYEEIRKTEVN